MKLAKTINGQPYMIEPLGYNRFRFIADKEFIVRGEVLTSPCAIRLFHSVELYGNIIIGAGLTDRETTMLLKHSLKQELKAN